MPAQASPPSRSSTASNSPVEAPEGTAARPRAPDSSATSTSTVGLPRESRIWRAWMEAMALTERASLFDRRTASGGYSPVGAARRSAPGREPSAPRGFFDRFEPGRLRALGQLFALRCEDA